MKRYVHLLDHNIDGAPKVAVEPGQYPGSVSLRLGGTTGHMTVNIAELLAALAEVMKGLENDQSREELKQKGELSAAPEQNGYSEPAAAIRRRAKKRRQPRGESAARTITKINRSSPVVLQDLFADLKVEARAEEPSKSDSREGAPWSEYEDYILPGISPEFAATKLRRTLPEIQTRRRQLGIKDA